MSGSDRRQHGKSPRDCFEVEVVFAWPDQAHSRRVSMPAGGTLSEAVGRSGLLQRLPPEVASDITFAVFGEPAQGERLLRPGDRVELLRGLTVDPREARRRRARLRRAGRATRQTGSSG